MNVAYWPRLFLLLTLFAVFSFTARGQNMQSNDSSDASIIQISDDHLIILTVDVAGISTGQYMEAYKHEGGFLFPLGVLSQIIHFQIDVDSENRKAVGWYHSQANTFSLDMNTQEVFVNGEKKDFNEALIVQHADDIYVDQSLFKAWFNLDFNLDYSLLKLKIDSNVLLPEEERRRRESKYDRFVYRTHQERPKLPRKDIPSSFISPPFFDITLGANHMNAPDTSETSYTYSVLSQSDLGYMTQRTFISGNKADDPTSLRFSLNETDVDGNLLGGLHAKKVSVGDIDILSRPLVLTGGGGRGLLLTNNDFNRSNTFDSRTFIGTLEPGWTVELYQNGVLLDFQKTGDDGRYQFLDIPVYYGNNIYKLVAYGPQGQIKEETFQNLIDDSILQQGRLQYNVSIDEKNQTLFGIDEKDRILEHEKRERILFDTEYGLTDSITAGLDFMRTPLEDGKTHDYLSGSIRTSFLGMFSSMDYTQDMEDDGYAFTFRNHSHIGSANLNSSYQKFSHFTSEYFNTAEKRLDSLYKADLVGTTTLFSFPNNYRLLGQRINYEDGRQEDSFKNYLSASIRGLRLTNELEWLKKTETDHSTSKLTQGNFSVRGRYHANLIRANLFYNIKPESEVTRGSISLQHRFNKDLNVQGDIDQSFTGDKNTDFVTSLNKRFNSFILSARASANTQKQYSVGLQISFGIGFEPVTYNPLVRRDGMAGRTAINPVGYFDHNDNDIYDDGDVLTDDVYFKTNASARQKTESGLITGLDPLTPQNFEMDTAALENPLWKTADPGYAVTAPPGTANLLPIKVHKTVEIEGTAWIYRRGKKTQAKGVPLILRDRSGTVVAETTTSSWDGYYSFANLKPGIYTLDISPNVKSQHNVTLANTPIFSALKSDIYSGKDILVVNKGAYVPKSVRLPKPTRVAPPISQPVSQPTVQPVTPSKPNGTDKKPYSTTTNGWMFPSYFGN